MADKASIELPEAAIEGARRLDLPIGAKLELAADDIRRRNPHFAQIVDRTIARLTENDVGRGAPRRGERMPEFLLPDETGQLVNLSQLRERGPVIISINRGHWCSYCRLYVDALARAQPEMSDLGAQIVAISPETIKWGAEFKRDANAQFHVLSDLDGDYALELNLLFWVGDEMRQAMTDGGIDISAFQGNDKWTLPAPATFVVGQDGIVAARFVDPDFRRRVEVDGIVDALRQNLGG